MIALLRGLPERLIRCGYLDALSVRGVLDVTPTLAADLDVLTPDQSAMVELWFLRREVARSRAEAALGEELVKTLVENGVLVERGQAVTTMNLVALPVLGQIALIASPPQLPSVFLGDEVALLATRLSPTAGTALVIGGSGVLALLVARTAARVIALEPDPVSVGCAELSFAINGAAHVDLRQASLDSDVDGGPFDRVVGVAPLTPMPVAFEPDTPDATGSAVLARMIERLAVQLSADGVAQFAGILLGGDTGPVFETRPGMRIVVTAASRQPLSPGSPLFEAFSSRLAASRRLDANLVRQQHQAYLAKRRASYLYLVAVTASRATRGSVEITRHWTRPGGGWQRLT